MTPRPYQLVAAGSLAPWVLTCEHASNRVPVDGPRGAAVQGLLKTHWAFDFGAWALARDLARRLGASAIGGRWSRLWVDLNRRVDDEALVRREAGGVMLPWNDHLTPAVLERRVTDYHTPYHNEIDRLILRRVVRGVRPVVFAVHSFTPVYDGRPRRFDVGILYEHHRRPAQVIARHVRAAGFVLRYNQPYSGMAGMMYAVDRHGSHHGLPCLEIEVNDALFAQPARVRRLAVAVEVGLRELTAR